jgi:hypothetical protein
MAVFFPTASKQSSEAASRKNHEAKAFRPWGLEHATPQLAAKHGIRSSYSAPTLALTLFALSA